MSNELARQGHSVDLVVCSIDGPYLDLISPNVGFVDLGKNRTASALLALARYLRTSQPACVICGMEHASILAIIAKRLAGSKTKVVASIRNTLSVQYATDRSNKSRLTLALAKRLFRHADVVSAVSRECADDAAKVLGIDQRRIGYIYNPTVTPKLFEKAKEVPDHPWLVQHDKPVIVAVGRLTEQKDYPTLLRAFARARQSRDCRLIILGDGELKPELERIACELGVDDAVSLPGFSQNPYAYLARADVYVLSSLFEGLPNVLIEALACGAPIVSTDCKSGPSEILSDGKWGKIVPVGDAEAMARAIVEQIDAGRVPRPPESYAPFLLETACDQYLRLALDG